MTCHANPNPTPTVTSGHSFSFSPITRAEMTAIRQEKQRGGMEIRPFGISRVGFPADASDRGSTRADQHLYLSGRLEAQRALLNPAAFLLSIVE